MLRWLSALLLTLALVAGAALLLQRQSAAQLRDEIALLQDESRQLAQLRAENARLLAAQAPAAEVERLRADRAAVVQLRGEIEKLKAGVAERERALKLPATAMAAPDVPEPAPVLHVLTAGRLKNAGRATPMAAVETVLWAGTGGNLDVLARTLAFEKKAGDLAGKMFEELPESSRREYVGSFRMIAALLAKEMPAGDVRMTEVRSTDPNPVSVEYDAMLRADDGDSTKTRFRFVKIDEQWLMSVPVKMVEHFSAEQRKPPAK